jgi:hypothetical protein
MGLQLGMPMGMPLKLSEALLAVQLPPEHPMQPRLNGMPQHTAALQGPQFWQAGQLAVTAELEQEEQQLQAALKASLEEAEAEEAQLRAALAVSLEDQPLLNQQCQQQQQQEDEGQDVSGSSPLDWHAVSHCATGIQGTPVEPCSAVASSC